MRKVTGSATKSGGIQGNRFLLDGHKTTIIFIILKMTNNYVKIEDVLSVSPNMQLVITAADLMEFAMSIANEVKNEIGNNKEDDTLYSPDDFAAKHHVNKSTLWRWCKAGILTKTIVGGKVYYRESNLKLVEE